MQQHVLPILPTDELPTSCARLRYLNAWRWTRRSRYGTVA